MHSLLPVLSLPTLHPMPIPLQIFVIVAGGLMFIWLAWLLAGVDGEFVRSKFAGLRLKEMHSYRSQHGRHAVGGQHQQRRELDHVSR